ncbi:MAG: hypothetical protein ACT4P7_23600 [Gemmatimonadaceae bacterium]
MHRTDLARVARLCWVALFCLMPLALGAQDRGSSGVPRWFASLGTGLQWSDFVVDQSSSSSWDFDAGFSLRGTVERDFGNRFAVGLAFNYARLPLTYATLGASATCASCAADATVSSYGGIVRMGGGPGFHQVIEIFVGALRYGNFEQTSPRQALLPESNTDFAFGAGYGFGYTLANDWHVQLIQDALNSLHERSTLPQGGGRVARHYTTRLGLRVGF